MQPGRRHLSTLIFFTLLMFLLMLSSAAAHAVLLESSPALKAAVPGPDVPIKLRFNVRIDAARSRLTLVGPDGASQGFSGRRVPPPLASSRFRWAHYQGRNPF